MRERVYRDNEGDVRIALVAGDEDVDSLLDELINAEDEVHELKRDGQAAIDKLKIRVTRLENYAWLGWCFAAGELVLIIVLVRSLMAAKGIHA